MTNHKLAWEYEILREGNLETLSERLNALGALGWEAVGLYTEIKGNNYSSNSVAAVVLLKRPV